MDDGYVGDDDYVRMLVLLATSMVMMMVPVMVTIGNGNEAYCSCEQNADRDTMVVALMVRKTMMAVLMVINIVMIMMDVRSDYVRMVMIGMMIRMLMAMLSVGRLVPVGWPVGPRWLASCTRLVAP